MLLAVVAASACHAISPYDPRDYGVGAGEQPAPRDSRPDRVAPPPDLPDAAFRPDGDFRIVIVDGGEACVHDEPLWYLSCQPGPNNDSCAIACGPFTIICAGGECSCAREDGESRPCIDFDGLATCDAASTCFMAVRDGCCVGL